MKTEAAVSRPGAPAPVIEELDLEPPRADEILVRIVAAGICHTDLRSHAGYGVPVPKPIVLGHEGAGVVEAAGAGVTGLAVGDHVVLSGASCGGCAACASGRPTYCRDTIRLSFGGARADGSTALSRDGERVHSHFFAQSSFARHAVAPARSATKAPRDVPLELLGPLGCGVITGAGAVIEALALRPGQSIAVFGAGGVGLSAVMAARLVGAGCVAAVDVNPARLTLARELGADVAVLSSEAAEVDGALRATRPDGFDAAFVTAPYPEVFDRAQACLGMEGALGFVAAPRDGWMAPMLKILAGGQRVQAILGGSAAPRAFIPMLIDHWRAGRFPFDRLITTYPFERIADAFADCHAGKVVKPVLLMSEAST